MLLAVFVARDYRPWLSVTGTCAAGFGSRQEWIRELVTGGRRSARYGFWGLYRRAPSNFLTLNCSTSTPSRQRTLSITMSLPPGPLPYAYDWIPQVLQNG